MITNSYKWLLNAWNVAIVINKLDLEAYSSLIKFKQLNLTLLSGVEAWKAEGQALENPCSNIDF